ncbi:MAG: ABC transporter permease [Gemmatimonadaceae bacterium]
MTTRSTQRIATLIAAIAASLLLLFLAIPTLALVARGGASGVRGLFTDAELRDAILLTVTTATTSTIVAMVMGTPLAWFLARHDFRGRSFVDALLDLPLLIPHPVAGMALLLVLSRSSALGGALLAAGIRVVSTPLGIIAAMLFVSAPLYVSAAREAIARVDPRYEGVARTLGDTRWRALRRVTLPIARRGLLAGAVVAWARASSEFGAIVILAYHPRVASVLSYDRLTGYGLREALPVAAALVLVALVPLILLRALGAYPGARRAENA